MHLLYHPMIFFYIDIESQSQFRIIYLSTLNLNLNSIPLILFILFIHCILLIDYIMLILFVVPYSLIVPISYRHPSIPILLRLYIYPILPISHILPILPMLPMLHKHPIALITLYSPTYRILFTLPIVGFFVIPPIPLILSKKPWWFKRNEPIFISYVSA